MNRRCPTGPPRSRRSAVAVAALVMAALLTGACSGSQDPVFEASGGAGAGGLTGTSVGDVIPRPALTLPDTTGAPFDLRARPVDELTVVYFGYTNCPDLCPTTMADLTSARRALAPAVRDTVRIVFVTEDPVRDTPGVLRAWLDRFDTGYVGLVGGNDVSRQALDALKASRTEIVRAGPEAAPGAAAVTRPVVEHSGSVYVFYRDEVVVYTGGTTPAQYADDFRALRAAT